MKSSLGSSFQAWQDKVSFIDQYILTGSGTIVARGLSFLSFMLVGRLLGPSEFGLFSLAFLVMTMVAQLSSAIDNAMIKSIGSDPASERKILFAAFHLKLGVHVGIFVIGALAVYPITNHLQHKEGFIPFYFLALAGGMFTALYNLALAHFQARQRFRAFAGLSTGFNALILAGICAICLTGNRSAMANLLWFIGLTVIAAIWWTIRSIQPFPAQEWRPHIRNVAHFGAWLGVATIAAAVHQRLDVFVMSAYVDYDQLGVYSAAVRISMIVDLFNSSAMVVLFPIAMSASSQEQWKRFRQQSTLIMAIGILATGMTIWSAPWLLKLFGDNFAEAATSSRLLCLANLILLIYSPISYVFYKANRPQLVAATGIIKLISAAALAFFLVPRLGANGAALTMVLTNVVALGFTAFWARKIRRNLPWNATEPTGSIQPSSPTKVAPSPLDFSSLTATITSRRRKDPFFRFLSGLLWRHINLNHGAERYLRNYYQRNPHRQDWQGRPACLLLSFDLDHEEDMLAIPRVLELLKSYGWPASYCSVGLYMSSFPRQHELILNNGHELINHTQNHPPNPLFHGGRSYIRLSETQLSEEIARCHETCLKRFGYTMRGFRAPHFGNQQNARTHRCLAQLGYAYSSSLIATHTPQSIAGMPFFTEGILEIPVSPSPITANATLETYTITRSAKRLTSEQYLNAFKTLMDITIANHSILNLYFDPRDVLAREDVFRATLQAIAKRENDLWITTYSNFYDAWTADKSRITS